MSRDRFREEEEAFPEGEVIEVDPIDIEGDPNAQEIAIDPIAIEGDASVRHKTPLPVGFDRFRSGETPNKDDVLDIVGQAIGLPGLGSGARSVGDAVTMGHADELVGMGEAALGGSYREGRDRVRSDLDTSRENYPVSSGVGTAVGIGATLPLLATQSAGTTAGRIGRGVVEGLGLGALSAEGESEGDPMSGQWLRDVGEGATAGAVTGGIFSSLGEGGRRMVNRLRGGADDAARRAAVQRVRQAGPERFSELSKIDNRGGVERVVEDLRRADPEVFGRRGWRTTDSTGERVAEIGAQALSSLDDIKAQLQGQRVSTQGVQRRLQSLLNDLGTGPEARGLREKLRGWIAEYGDELPFEELQRRAETVGSMLNVDARTPSHDERLRRALYGALKDAQAEAAESRGLGDAWRQANRETELGLRFGDLSSRNDLRDQANRLVSPSDYFAGGVGSMQSDNGVLGGVTGWLLNRTLRNREPALRANWNEALARVGRALPEGSGGDVLDMLRRVTATQSPEVAGAVKNVVGGPQVDTGLPDEAPAEMAPVEVGGEPELTPEDTEALEALGLGDAPDELTDEDQAALEALGL